MIIFFFAYVLGVNLISNLEAQTANTPQKIAQAQNPTPTPTSIPEPTPTPASAPVERVIVREIVREVSVPASATQDHTAAQSAQPTPEETIIQRLNPAGKVYGYDKNDKGKK